MSKTVDGELSISLTNVCKTYFSYEKPGLRLIELLLGGKRRYARETKALNEVSLQIRHGEKFGILGANGSGKSTLLKVIAGVLQPTSGQVKVQGRISALLELGAGFNGDISGMDNVRLYCDLHGLDSRATDAIVDEIIDFAEIGDAIRYPVRTYSSGMAVRLGFSCAVHVDPDILIIDEALSVGDVYFQNKCLARIRSMLEKGVTFIYVTHSSDSIQSLCERAIWMQNGMVSMEGPASEVGAAYRSEAFGRLAKSGTAVDLETARPEISTARSSHTLSDQRANLNELIKLFGERAQSFRVGSGEARVDYICCVLEDGSLVESLGFGDQGCVQVGVSIRELLTERVAVTLGITDQAGREIAHFNSLCSGIDLSSLPIGAQVHVRFKFQNNLCPGEYGLIAGIAEMTLNPLTASQHLPVNVIDHAVGAARFAVTPTAEAMGKDLWGFVHLNYTVSIES